MQQRPLTRPPKMPKATKQATPPAKQKPARPKPATTTRRITTTTKKKHGVNPATVTADRKERLAVESDRLNTQAALLSNTLADFAPGDLAGRKAVVDELTTIRANWKAVRHEIETGEAPKQATDAPKPTEIRLGMSEAQVKAEIQKNQVNLSKLRRKLEDKPGDKKAGAWEADVARLTALINDYRAELVRIQYE
ncbi:hypothetical protein FAES_3749 [Fibrella aestuarina BUZ 2]|uniref:Uncharacterized protein n=1 Tax=Fibrella aestuarina BUZ 2 TaxID=1166018 RepID=I0KCA3_9BACT|nr:hypothetical protein FAES_3749 [Fibrella aestuarina BUZ 2]